MRSSSLAPHSASHSASTQAASFALAGSKLSCMRGADASRGAGQLMSVQDDPDADGALDDAFRDVEQLERSLETRR